MANGKPNKEPGYCDYQFEDGTYCKEKIEGYFLHESGQILRRTGWGGAGQRNYCLFHSHMHDKWEFLYPEIKKRINDANDSVKKKIAELDSKLLSYKEKKKSEIKIRNENPLDFEGFYFPIKADFKDSNFETSVIFNKAEFGGEASFEIANFGGEATFRNAKFSSEVSFWSAKFEDTVSFRYSEFGGKALFEKVIFGGEASFSTAEFGGVASFCRSLFLKSAAFSATTFMKAPDFTDAAFLSGKLDFTRTRFLDEEATFHNTAFNCEVLFREQMLKGVRFTGCYLGSASFYGSDVRDAVFINSSWNRSFLEKQIEILKKDKRIEESISVLDISKKPPRTRRRAILFNESESSNPELDPLYLEHLYCQFKLAMDRNKMYGLANDFYHGEKLMETKRLWKEHSYLKWLFLRLYWLLSGFGNSPWRAIISLIFILFASSFLLIKFNGLNAEKPKEAYERCPCERNEIKPAAAIKQNLKTSTASTKARKSYISKLIYNSLAPLNALNQSAKPPQSTGTPAKVSQKKEAGYSLKSSYWCNAFHISLWNLTASPGRRSGDYKENGILAYLAIFCIQYIFRPLMVALIIISVRRKVYRG